MKITLRPLEILNCAALALLLGACADTNNNVAGGDNSSQGTLIATTRTPSGGRSAPAAEGAGEPEGIVRRDGRLYYVKNRGTSILTGRQRVTRALFLESNGDVTLLDGRRVRVVEGYMVTSGGEVIEAPGYLR